MKRPKASVAPFLQEHLELMRIAVSEDEQDKGLSKTQLQIAKLAINTLGYSPKTAPTVVYEVLVKTYDTRESNIRKLR